MKSELAYLANILLEAMKTENKAVWAKFKREFMSACYDGTTSFLRRISDWNNLMKADIKSI